MTTSAAQPSKIIYIDRLRVALTALVIIHHAAVTYGAAGSWYYIQKTGMIGAVVPMVLLTAVDQSFFMGFFFFLSALFVPVSFDKKGPAKFTSDRLFRLGIPLAMYSFVLSPFYIYLVYRWPEGHDITYAQFLGGFDGWINFGVMWFVAALLIFTLCYVAYKMTSGPAAVTRPLPSAGRILLFATFVGVVSFAVRTVYPVGRTLDPVGFQLGHFPQYIAMFCYGIVAARSRWLEEASYDLGRRMRTVALCLILGMPGFFVLRKMLDFPIEYYSSGLHWQSLLYAVWEQLAGFSIVAALLCTGKFKWNKPSATLGKLARLTFAAYVFHPLVLISLSVVMHTWTIDPAFKFLIAAPAGVVITFLLAAVLVRVPFLNKIL